MRFMYPIIYSIIDSILQQTTTELGETLRVCLLIDTLREKRYKKQRDWLLSKSSSLTYLNVIIVALLFLL